VGFRQSLLEDARGEPLAFVVGAGSGWLVWKLAEAPVHAAMRGWGRPAPPRLA